MSNKNNSKLIKRLITGAMCLTLVFSINGFASVVSDNDGSAFITKAEFDSLKNNFQSQIDQYNQSIDSKIDGAIAAYLQGIKLVTSKNVNFIYAKKKCAETEIKDIMWTKSTDWALRWPNGTQSTNKTEKDSVLIDYDWTFSISNNIYGCKRHYYSDYDWPLRFIIDKKDGLIKQWGNYSYKIWLKYELQQIDVANGAATTNYATGNVPYFWQTDKIWNGLKNMGRPGAPQTMGICADWSGKPAGKTAQYDNMFLYGVEEFHVATVSEAIRFAPLSRGCECTITDNADDQKTLIAGTDYTTGNSGSGSNYKNGNDSYWSSNGRSWVQTKLSDVKTEYTQAIANGVIRLEYDMKACWWTNYNHNDLKWDCLVSGGGVDANAPIKCGMLFGNISDTGTLRIKTTSGISGKMVYYIGTAPSDTWNGKINTYLTDASCTITANVTNQQEFIIEDKNQNLYLVWLPDTDAPLPTIEAQVLLDE